jgi:hypothetical protein
MEKQKRTPANLKGGDIFKRKEQACYYDAGLGCSGNYCWKACGAAGEGTYCPSETFQRAFADVGLGKWCWTAQGDGGGAWNQCTKYSDCDGNAACGKGCAPGNGSCGCSC